MFLELTENKVEEFNHTMYHSPRSPEFATRHLYLEDFFCGPFLLHKFLKSKFLWNYFKFILDLLWLNDFIWHKMEELMAVNVKRIGAVIH